MKSDIWLNKGYKKGDIIQIIQDTVNYCIWVNQCDTPIGLTINFEYADDVHYDLDYVDWLLFLHESLNITSHLIFDKALKNFFLKADCFSFEKELTKVGIEFSKIAYY